MNVQPFLFGEMVIAIEDDKNVERYKKRKQRLKKNGRNNKKHKK